MNHVRRALAVKQAHRQRTRWAMRWAGRAAGKGRVGVQGVQPPMGAPIAHQPSRQAPLSQRVSGCRASLRRARRGWRRLIQRGRRNKRVRI